MKTCELCQTHEALYKYTLNDNTFVLICALCGKVLWEYKIDTKDRLLQLVEMLEKIKFENKIREMEKRK